MEITTDDLLEMVPLDEQLLPKKALSKTSLIAQEISSWTTTDVAAWLQALPQMKDSDGQALMQAVQKAQITGAMLLEIQSLNDLELLGVGTVAQRSRLWMALLLRVCGINMLSVGTPTRNSWKASLTCRTRNSWSLGVCV